MKKQENDERFFAGTFRWQHVCALVFTHILVGDDRFANIVRSYIHSNEFFLWKLKNTQIAYGVYKVSVLQ